MHIYIAFETLKVKCTQYGICSQAAFNNARAMIFSKFGGADSCFQSGSKKSQAGAKTSQEGCPRPCLTSLEVHGGDFNVPREKLWVYAAFGQYLVHTFQSQVAPHQFGIALLERSWLHP